jgi:hypothetical protein
VAGLMNSCAAISELEVPSPAGPPRPFASTPRAASKGTAGGRPALARSRAGQAGHRSMSPVSAEPSTQSPRGPARRDLDALGTASLVRPRLGRRPMLPGAVGRSGVEADGNRAHVSRSQRCAGSCSVRGRQTREDAGPAGAVEPLRVRSGDSSFDFSERTVVTLAAQARAEPTPQRHQIRSAVSWARQSAPRFPAFQAQVEGGNARRPDWNIAPSAQVVNPGGANERAKSQKVGEVLGGVRGLHDRAGAPASRVAAAGGPAGRAAWRRGR